MTKEQYKEKMDSLNAQIVQLKRDFVNANKPCDHGARVDVKRGNGEIEKAIVVAFKIDWKLDVEPILRKIKKDGNISELSVRVWRSEDKIIYPEKQNA